MSFEVEQEININNSNKKYILICNLTLYSNNLKTSFLVCYITKNCIIIIFVYHEKL